MKPKIFIPFCLLGVVLLCGGLLLSWLCADASPLLLYPSEAALQRTEDFMNALEAGDLDTAGSILLEQPRLSAEWSEASPITTTLWLAYIDCFRFEFQNTLTPTDSGCCRCVTVTALDIPALMQQLNEAAPELLAQEALRIGEEFAFDENDHYHQSFVMEVLRQSLEAFLNGSYPTVSREYTLELVLQKDTWWILPSQDLMDLICGNIS